jgi:hypothetical protein
MASNYTGNYTGISAGGQMKAQDVTDALNKMEKVAYKVTALSSSSTDTQYPSAKTVYTGLAAKAAASDVSALSSTVTALSGTVTALQTTVSGLQDKLPVGTILMYDGINWVNNQTLPGWYKCDGANGTPNLTNLFVRGGASSGGTGGANSQSITLATDNMPKHSHTLSGTLMTDNQSAGHTHSIAHDHGSVTSGGISDDNYAQISNQDSDSVPSGRASSKNPRSAWNPTGDSGSDCRDIYIDLAHTHSVDLPNFTGNSGGVSADHTHNVTLSGSTGDAGSTADIPTAIIIDTVPAYYALIYIKKVA